MTMDMFGLTKEDLVDGAEVVGAMEFIDMSEGGQIILV
jgi:peroxiredoxin family protein